MNTYFLEATAMSLVISGFVAVFSDKILPRKWVLISEATCVILFMIWLMIGIHLVFVAVRENV